MVRGITYFGVVFGVGFLLGIVRVVWLEPTVGVRIAELTEAPFMLAAIVLAARYVIFRFPASRRREYLFSGGLALMLLLLLEFSVVLWLRGQSILQSLADRDPVAGAVYVILLLLFAAMPWLLAQGSFSSPRPPR
jgi:hypothetical protein